MSKWLVINTGLDKIEDLRLVGAVHHFESHLEYPTPGQIADAVTHVMDRADSYKRPPEGRVLLVPMDDAVDLGLMRGRITYEAVNDDA